MKNCNLGSRKNTPDAVLRGCACDACGAKLAANIAGRKRCAARRKIQLARIANGSGIIPLLVTARKLSKALRGKYHAKGGMQRQLQEVGLTEAQARTLLARHRKRAKAERDARKRLTSIVDAMRNKAAASDTGGHVGEVDPDCDHREGCTCGVIDWGEKRSGSWHGVMDGALASRSYGTLHWATCQTATDRPAWMLSSMVPPKGRKGIEGEGIPLWEPHAVLYIASRQINGINALEQGDLSKAQILSMIRECTRKTVAEHPGMVPDDTFATFCRSLGLGRHNYCENVGRDAGGRGGEVTERATR